MPVVVASRLSYTVSIDADDSRVWRVPDALVSSIDGEAYVKLQAHCTSLVKLLCPNSLDKAKNVTLAHTIGMKRLRELRNSCATTADDPSPSGVNRLFGPPVQKKLRKSADRVQQMRKTKETIDVTIPKFGEYEDTIVEMVVPAHPNDDIICPLKNLPLNVLFAFLEHNGVSRDELTKKRQYKRNSALDEPLGEHLDGAGDPIGDVSGDEHERAGIDNAIHEGMDDALAGDGIVAEHYRAAWE